MVDSKETGLEVNAGKSKYIVMSGDQNAGRSHSMNTDNSCFGRVQEFIYLGTTLTNQILIQEEIKRSLKSGNVLLSFGAESFVFQFAIQKYKD